MDELNNDPFLKEILQSSRMEITSPHFEEMMMQKILAQDKKRRTVKDLSLYALIFLSTDAILFTFYKLLNFGCIENANQLLPKASVVTHSVQSILTQHSNWLIPITGVIFLFSMLAWAGSGLGSSHVRHT